MERYQKIFLPTTDSSLATTVSSPPGSAAAAAVSSTMVNDSGLVDGSEFPPLPEHSEMVIYGSSSEATFTLSAGILFIVLLGCWVLWRIIKQRLCIIARLRGVINALTNDEYQQQPPPFDPQPPLDPQPPPVPPLDPQQPQAFDQQPPEQPLPPGQQSAEQNGASPVVVIRIRERVTKNVKTSAS